MGIQHDTGWTGRRQLSSIIKQVAKGRKMTRQVKNNEVENWRF